MKYWAKRICKFFELKGFLILKSSSNNYHVVFDRSVSWEENGKIMALAALMVEGRRLHKCPLTKYMVMQFIKGMSTLRIGRKKNKPSPRTIFKFRRLNNEIRNYLRFRRAYKKFRSATSAFGFGIKFYPFSLSTSLRLLLYDSLTTSLTN